MSSRVERGLRRAVRGLEEQVAALQQENASLRLDRDRWRTSAQVRGRQNRHNELLGTFWHARYLELNLVSGPGLSEGWE